MHMQPQIVAIFILNFLLSTPPPFPKHLLAPPDIMNSCAGLRIRDETVVGKSKGFIFKTSSSLNPRCHNQRDLKNYLTNQIRKK